MRTSIGYMTLLGAALAAPVVGCASYDSAVVSEDYEVAVVATDIAFIDGLAFHPAGGILATEEYRGGGVVHVDPASGARSHLIRDLASPDNLIVVDGRIYVTEEDTRGRIVELDELLTASTFADGLVRPEGMDLGPDGALYIAEHSPSGKVYRFEMDGSRQTIGPVTNGEGLRCLPDGSIVVAETSADRIVRFLPDGTKVTITEGTVSAPDGVAYDADGGRILVSEDAAPGRIVEIDVDSGEVSTIASGLNLPQTMLIEESGAILVAEQGEDRILRLRPRGESR